jgi:tRNA(fMet)-specific endonuclease VapC
MAEKGRSDVSLYVSVLSVFEIEVGILKSDRKAENRVQYGNLLAQLQTLPLDEDDALAAGEIRAALERLGGPIGAYDYLIAAQALRRDWVLVTANEREFRRVKGLKIENWAR